MNLQFFIPLDYGLKDTRDTTKYNALVDQLRIKSRRQKREMHFPSNDISMQSQTAWYFIFAGSILQRILLPTLSGIGGHVAVVAGIVRHVKTDGVGRGDTLQRPSQRRHR